MIRPVPPPDFVPFPRDAVEESIVTRWRRMARDHAARPALRVEGRTFTYAELDSESETLARRIAAQANRAHANVAILRSDTAGQIAAMLAVLKAGHAFVILDPGQPAVHHAQLIELAEAALVVGDDGFPGIAGAALPERIDPAANAYLLFTSGSTGQPKGVAQAHCNVLHNVFKYANGLGMAPSDRHTLLGSLVFAASMTDLFGALLTGACLCAYRTRALGATGLSQWMKRERITVYFSVPTVFRHWVETIPAGTKFADLRVIKLGGEAVLRADVESFRRCFQPPTLLLSTLGTSELNTIRQYFIDHALAIPEGATVPVGYALPETGVELVEEEIVVSSDFLPAGYWRDPELSAKIFPNGGKRFYTGDRGRLLPDGCLVHLGRKDERLKVRGVSIEPSEIEGAIRTTGLARDAVVMVCGQPPRLAAFVTGCTDTGQLRTGLQARLPSHLVPDLILALNEMPLLSNGKVDRMQLAGSISATATAGGQPPDITLDPLETQLIQIWKKELRLDHVGLNDDFFAIGGDSLTAVAVFAGIDRALRLDLPISTLVHHPTIKKLAAVIRNDDRSLKNLRLVGLEIRGSKPPLYCAPGGASDALQFRHLARRLGRDQPFYVFQPKGMDGYQPYPLTVEEIAEYNLETLREHQPHGPYRLCGASFGGLVAYEMARKLVAAGEQIAFLGLLDTYGYRYPRLRRDAPLRKKIKHDELQALLAAIRMHGLSMATVRNCLRERWQLHLARLDLAFQFRPLPRPPELRWTYSWEACDRARLRYTFRSYSGKIHLFRAEIQPAPKLNEYSRSLGWEGIAEGGLEIFDLPGTHKTHLEEPQVAVLAGMIAACLDRA